MNDYLLSLCIPTYGVEEWVFPVLDSIYSQGIDETLYEVVVTDNGNNENFKNRARKYAESHENFVYKETQSFSFLNEIDSYKIASGKFIKFINHRTLMLPGALQKLLSFVMQNEETKPCVYFSNGVLKFKGIKEFSTFDEYVLNLSYFSSWSTGMAFWKEDFERIDAQEQFNELFPHTNILFHERKKTKYIINNEVLLEELPTNGIAKGKYDLFFAFAVEYVAIILSLLRSGDITVATFEDVKDKNLSFLANLYIDYVFLKRECSYDLSSLKESIKVFYSGRKLRKRAFKEFNKRAFRKILRIG